ncbi:vesicle-fusing ATPase-like [Hydra vulgaris]|uniref:Vesicle-fusing ATPase n=1 Tax=Hydra vulgaris TaxID=6087 RepID=A0ABM4D9Q1_HYDVU
MEVFTEKERRMLTVTKSPSDELSLTNCLVINKDLFKDLKSLYRDELFAKISFNNGTKFTYKLCSYDKIRPELIGLSYIQRIWTDLTLERGVDVSICVCTAPAIICKINIKVDFLYKKNKIMDSFNTDLMSKKFNECFGDLPFTIGQKLVFKFTDKMPLLLLVVDKIECIENSVSTFGLLNMNSLVIFDKAENSDINLTGKYRGAATMTTTSILNPDWDFSKMGVGGLDKEFSVIFRRAFVSRVYPSELVEQLGLQHVKGILLYGPPGTGKTLMARQIGKMLNASEPKIVNGPEILNKFVGESEKNIRVLFEDAEADKKKYGVNSPLHMIIFDEIDAICRQRGTATGSTGVADTVVNQLLSKMDGVQQLNNILIIGMTNRKDLIDEALLRPGRLELQMEINLPNEEGRLQILNIHTLKLQEHKKLHSEVDLKQISVQIKNYSGAEIEGLVRAATTNAMNKFVSQGQGKVEIHQNAVESLLVTKTDFDVAASDIKPAFGSGTDDADHYLGIGIFEYGNPISSIIEFSKSLIKQAQSGCLVSPVSLLLHGPEGSGKTALAAHLAYKLSNFPFVKVVSSENMSGYSESSRCQAITKIFDDAYKSELSCIIVDDIEGLFDYIPIGPRFSNLVLRMLIVLLKKKTPKNNKLLIITTCNSLDVLRSLQVLNCFNATIEVPAIRDVVYMINILNELKLFNNEEIREIESSIKQKSFNISLKKLICLAERAKQYDDSKVVKFIYSLDQECDNIY